MLPYTVFIQTSDSIKHSLELSVCVVSHFELFLYDYDCPSRINIYANALPVRM